MSVITKPWPSLRSVSTACCMRCAAAGSSQVPKASTRSGTVPGTTMPVSPKISGSSLPAAQATSTCGSDSSSVLSRSISARSAMVSSCAAASIVAAALRVRISTMMASTAKQSSPSVSVRAATCWRLTAVTVRIMSSMRLTATSAPARAGVLSALQSVAKTKAARNPPRRGRERSLSFAVRIVSGIQTCPRNASGVRRAVRESTDFTPTGNRAERVQIVNGPGSGRAVIVLLAHDLIRKPVPAFRGHALFQRFGPLRHVLDVDAAERGRKCALGFDQRRLHHVIDQRRVRQRRIAGVLAVLAARRMSSALMRRCSRASS